MVLGREALKNELWWHGGSLGGRVRRGHSKPSLLPRLLEFYPQVASAERDGRSWRGSRTRRRRPARCLDAVKQLTSKSAADAHCGRAPRPVCIARHPVTSAR
jgi:hypothetical protein